MSTIWPVLLDGDVGDAAAVGVDPAHGGVVLKDDAEPGEVRDPRVDPHLVGGARQHGVDIHAVCHQPETELESNRADGARAALFRTDGDHQPGEALAQELLVAGGTAVRLRELPPRDVLVLVEPPLVAARQPDEQPADVMQHVPQRNEASEIERAADGGLPIVPIAREPRADQHVGRARPCERRPRGRDEVVQDAARIVAKRDARHRVVDVTVEPGEEPESVLAGEQLPAIDGAVRDRDAAGLPAENRLALEDANLEAPFRKFVRSAQPADASAQNGHRLSHAFSCPEESLLLE
jgi:hypothetical protein